MNTNTYALKTTRIYAISSGSGPTVICMHGITGNAYVFEPIVNRLADRFHMVSIDQRGHGRSGRPANYRGEDFADDVAALVDHLDCGPAILVGHSLGARNALIAANRYPGHVRAVVALDFTPFIEKEVLDQLAERVNGGDRKFESIEEIEAYLRQRYPRLPEDAISRRARYGYYETGDGWRPLASPEAMRHTAEGLRDSLEDAVLSLKRPAVMVRGAESKLVSEEAWRKTRQLRPDLRYVVLAGSDHYIPEIKPAEIAELVSQVV